MTVVLGVLYAIVYAFLAFGAQRVVTKLNSIEEQRIRVKLGAEANLTCDGITAYHDTVLLFNNTSIVERPGKFLKLPNGAIKILDIQPSDTGMYKYKQSSDDLSYIKHCIIYLEINGETMKAKPESTVTMYCEVTAPMENWLQVLWRRKYSSETKTIVNNGSVTDFAKQDFSGRVSASGKKLVIRYAEKGDSGKYICTVVFKDPQLPRDNYYINLVVSVPPTIKPTSNEVIGKSSTSTPLSKSAPKQKSCAASLASQLSVAILVLLSFLV